MPDIKLKDFKPRLYQEAIFNSAADKNTLVVLPTGLGKTHIFVMLAIQRLGLFPESKILFLGPTRPLIDQYRQVFEANTTIEKELIGTFTGRIKPEKRQEQWKHKRVIFSTPQGIENDIIGNRINFKDVALIGFDEAHRAIGEYSYVWLAKKYMDTARFPRIIALTASPGHNLDKITDVCENLQIEAVEIRSDRDPDVKPYVQDVNVEWVMIDFPKNLASVRDSLLRCFRSKISEVRSNGFFNRPVESVTRTDILAIQKELYTRMASGEKSFSVLRSISLLAEAMKVQHALELVESQGIESLIEYLENLISDSAVSKVKAVKNLVADPDFKDALVKARTLSQKGIEHPKLSAMLEKVADCLKDKPDAKIIIFNQYRSQIKVIVEKLNTLKNVTAFMFVGQAKKKDTGLSQKEQIALLDRFRNNEFNVLCMSSVGEEGLDIPQVDTVIFYEPIPSAIRHIQRRGRTGRNEKGAVIIFVTKNTRDEAYRWSARHKENRMYRTLQDLKKKMAHINFSGSSSETSTTSHSFQNNNSLNNFASSKASNGSDAKITSFVSDKKEVKIIVDTRERPNRIVKDLDELGATISVKTLDTADYVLSDRVAAEVKTIPDFVDSIVDGRLLDQISNIKSEYHRPLLIIEGTQDIFSQRRVHPNAIRGMIAAIVVSWNVPILYSSDSKETAALLYLIAAREQTSGSRSFSQHPTKPRSFSEKQEYIVSSIPGIGSAIAPKLLSEFGSVRNFMNASEKDLALVDLIGKKKAAEITRIIEAPYVPNKTNSKDNKKQDS